MPTYDYRCAACDHRFEKHQRITEPAGALCPACGDPDCKRLITGGTFHLKGSGWYASDYHASKSAKDDSPPEAPKAGGCGLPQCGTGACAAATADA
ncbi:MAG: zinc ribbon domain-containing protein [Deltaproteobacteria bacterium]|nr:zinc ribbon domain-containing protein [Deltaproteobacteria bacterium]